MIGLSCSKLWLQKLCQRVGLMIALNQIGEICRSWKMVGGWGEGWGWGGWRQQWRRNSRGCVISPRQTPNTQSLAVMGGIHKVDEEVDKNWHILFKMRKIKQFFFKMDLYTFSTHYKQTSKRLTLCLFNPQEKKSQQSKYFLFALLFENIKIWIYLQVSNNQDTVWRRRKHL